MAWASSRFRFGGVVRLVLRVREVRPRAKLERWALQELQEPQERRKPVREQLARQREV